MDWMSSEYKTKLTLSQSKVYLKLQPDKPCMLWVEYLAEECKVKISRRNKNGTLQPFCIIPIWYIDCNTLINLSLEAKCFNWVMKFDSN